ncbi:hypothetical protein [Zhongshania arctica]|uniref:DUF3604 domain-containing protein n=1 Tax=Zhongshania arctica TaxID=3238302 RepID=A0ABV3TRE8_9GAMM
MLSTLLSACGGSSVSGTKSTKDNSAAVVFYIIGDTDVASNTLNTLRVESNVNGDTGSWDWQFDNSQLDQDAVLIGRDSISYTAPAVSQATILSFWAERRLPGQEIQKINKLVRVYPADDQNKRPTVNAGSDLNAEEGATIVLRVMTSAQGGRSIRSIEWQQQSGPIAEIIGAADQDTLTIKLPQVDSSAPVVFGVFAYDSGGFTGFDEIEVRVLDTFVNALPVVDAGIDREAQANTEIHFDGSASDSDGELVSLLWEALEPDQALNIRNSDTLKPSLITPNVSVDRVMKIRFTAIDDKGGSSSDTVSVLIRAAVNQPPQIRHAYIDPGVAYSGETVALLADAQDADGNTLHYQWSQLVEENQAILTITDDESPTAAATLPILTRNYNFKLKLAVSDGRDIETRDISLQGIANVKPQPDLFSCLSQPLQQGCPLSPLASVLNPDNFIACATDPSSSECIFTKIAGPAVLACVDAPGPQTCGAALANVADPSYVLEQLGEEDSAGQCNPAFDERSFEHYIGALHEHTAYSDGTYLSRPADVFASVKAAGFDFSGSSDHSDNMAIPLSAGRGDCAPEQILDCLVFVDDNNRSDAFLKWRATQEQALAASDENFTAFRGFEWTSDRFGHANVFFSRNIINAKTGPGYALTMARFWQWFSYPAEFGGGSDGLLSFNHPGREDAIESIAESFGGDPGFTFNDFRYVKAADYRTVGIEVFGKGSEYDSDGPLGSWLSYALDKGWYLGPVGSEDHHDTRWGDADLPKTVLISRSRSRDDLREAMLARRFYAVAQSYNDIRLDFRIDGQVMGSRLRRVIGSDLNVKLSMASNSATVIAPRFELVGPGNSVIARSSGSHWETTLVSSPALKYVFVRVFDGDRPIAFSAPIWLQEGAQPLPKCLVPQVWKDKPALLPSI